MNKPNGYDEAKTSTGFTPINLGGHYAMIKQVEERQSSTGKDMIVVQFDFYDPDEQVGYFSKMFDADDREDKKWPFAGTKYIMVQDYENPKKTSRNFKTFCSCYEKSNNCEIQWGGSAWEKQFCGKYIGVVFGEEEHEYDGNVSMRRVPKWFCSWDKVAEARTPQPKYLPGRTTAAKPINSTEFMQVSEEDAEVPF